MKFYIKKLLTIYCLILLVFAAQAQVPNAGFENWTGGEPDNWITNNLSGLITTITQSNNAHSGSSAAELQVFDIDGLGIGPYMTSVDAQGSFLGFPITQSYQELNGYYQFTAAGNSILLVSVGLYRTTASDTMPVGVAVFATNATTNTYTQFTAPILYFPGGDNPNWANITIQITDTLTGFPALGASALIDDLAFQGVVGIEDEIQDQIAKDYVLEQNYPNPFNPSTQISFSLPTNADVEIVIYDQIGRDIDRLSQGSMSAGNHSITWSAQNLPSGIYYYQLQANGRKLTRQMMLLK